MDSWVGGLVSFGNLSLTQGGLRMDSNCVPSSLERELEISFTHPSQVIGTAKVVFLFQNINTKRKPRLRRRDTDLKRFNHGDSIAE